MLNVGSLKNGIVLDHIKAGKAMDIYKYLGLDKIDSQVAIIKNAKSNKLGKKDIIKIDAPYDLANLDILGFVDDNITVSIIENDVVTEKRKLELPLTLTNILYCKNPRCISSIEQELPHIFVLSDRETKTYRCKYCEEKF